MTATVLGFVGAAIVLNILMYGGIFGVYLRDKHRDDRPSLSTPTEHAASSPFATTSDTDLSRLDLAA